MRPRRDPARVGPCRIDVYHISCGQARSGLGGSGSGGAPGDPRAVALSARDAQTAHGRHLPVSVRPNRHTNRSGTRQVANRRSGRRAATAKPTRTETRERCTACLHCCGRPDHPRRSHTVSTARSAAAAVDAATTASKLRPVRWRSPRARCGPRAQRRPWRRRRRRAEAGQRWSWLDRRVGHRRRSSGGGHSAVAAIVAARMSATERMQSRRSAQTTTPT